MVVQADVLLPDVESHNYLHVPIGRLTSCLHAVGHNCVQDSLHIPRLNINGMSQDPHYISFPRSDGDVKKWPTSITENPNAAGEVNWMHYLDLDDPTNEKWRTTVGDSLMRSFKWTGKVQLYLHPPDFSDCVNRRWPAVYLVRLPLRLPTV